MSLFLCRRFRTAVGAPRIPYVAVTRPPTTDSDALRLRMRRLCCYEAARRIVNTESDSSPAGPPVQTTRILAFLVVGPVTFHEKLPVVAEALLTDGAMTSEYVVPPSRLSSIRTFDDEPRE